MRSLLDKRKSLGDPITYLCDCGKVIQAHTTTWNFAVAAHRRRCGGAGEVIYQGAHLSGEQIAKRRSTI